MYEDDPQDTVFDVLGVSVFGDHPLGRPIIGRAPVIRDTPVDEIAAFHARRYVPSSVVVAAAGLDRPRRGGGAGRADARRPARGGERARARGGAAAAARARALPAQGHRAGARVPRRARAPARRRAALRRPRARRRSSAGSRPRASSRPCARSAAWPTPSTPSRASSRTRGRSASTSARGRTTWRRPCRSWPRSSSACAPARSATEELSRAQENVKARVVLALESSSARMNRLGASTLYDLPLLEAEELMARVDAVSLDALARAGGRAVGARAPVGRGHRAVRGRLPRRRGARLPGRGGRARLSPAARRRRRRRRAAGSTVCAAVEAADDLELDGPRRPGARHVAGRRARRLRRRGRLHAARHRARQRADGARRRPARGHRDHGLRPGGAARGGRGVAGQRLRGPELRHRRRADDALRRRGARGTSPRAEIIEYHHAAKLDAPSGTAARTAELMEGDVPDPLPPPARAHLRPGRRAGRPRADAHASATSPRT